MLFTPSPVVVDYCEDGDRFTQILGQGELVKQVFVQLLEYSHSLDTCHRDLRPGGVLCFDGGLHLAITDFGYHMSPIRCFQNATASFPAVAESKRCLDNTFY